MDVTGFLKRSIIGLAIRPCPVLFCLWEDQERGKPLSRPGWPKLAMARARSPQRLLWSPNGLLTTTSARLVRMVRYRHYLSWNHFREHSPPAIPRFVTR